MLLVVEDGNIFKYKEIKMIKLLKEIFIVIIITQIAFIALQLFNAILWSWRLVLSPIEISLFVVVLFFGVKFLWENKEW